MAFQLVGYYVFSFGMLISVIWLTMELIRCHILHTW